MGQVLSSRRSSKNFSPPPSPIGATYVSYEPEFVKHPEPEETDTANNPGKAADNNPPNSVPAKNVSPFQPAFGDNVYPTTDSVAQTPSVEMGGKQGGKFLVPVPPEKDTLEDGYCTSQQLFNYMNDSMGSHFIFDTRYMLILDCREKSAYAEKRIVTAKPGDAIYTDYGCLLHDGQLKHFVYIVLYGEGSELFPGSELFQLYKEIKACEYEPEILVGGYEEFSQRYPFLCTDRMVASVADRRAYISYYPSEIVLGALYQGRGDQATNEKIVSDLKITHIVNISKEHPNGFPLYIKYMNVRVDDDMSANVTHLLPRTTEFIAEAIESGGRVLVHCNLGISRSSTITMAYLMKERQWTMKDAFDFLKERRQVAQPNMGFLRQLSKYEVELFGAKLTDIDDIYF
ncbi:dual specificity protein phosphatase 2-like [Branchiostoma floridae]|uniref:Dual specificity protein phosphatase 2-like n=1 Tax=Branchiostoma floridae TaxID=7739 RepID=A0A9J7MLI8_BRAFL|nr:dual specificity protein phosphatase 2-like [Branchiostoma floridae]XP_035671437.1 dual specificity protein phosphatase 2-like [Branchiostoma floridae]XP_035671438.1 dual specificity protein phosphatase 2-like [Branchiostoma floridae]